ncbi:MAG TPA: SpoIIE family protein phosphatase [Candidatus Binataceae bacterium]|nr:SpoIIE family protein phosphatase [Candidatus Binataceae bacterium]
MLTGPGRAPAFLALAIAAALRIINPSPIDTLRFRLFDFEQWLRPRPYVQVPARVVAIDEKSVDKYGQWPWPRTLFAQLISRLAEGHPSAIGVDIIFSEPDRFSPDMLAATVPQLPADVAQKLKSIPPNEVKLAEAISKAPVVLAIGSADNVPSSTRDRSQLTVVREKGENPRPFLLPYPPLRSLPQLTAVEHGRGADIGQPDRDGTLRRIPLFVIAEGNLMPALALEMLRVASNAGSVEVVTARNGIRGAVVGNVLIPTDRDGRAYPYFTPSYDERYISAADILDGSYDIAKLHNVAIFLGVNALGLVDLSTTPVGLMPGVEVHEQLFESILTGNLLHRPAILNSIEIMLVIVTGLLTIYAVPYRSPSLAIAIVTASAIAMVLCEFASFRLFGLLFNTVYPAFSTLVIFGVMLGTNLRAAETARRRLSADLAQERHMEARMEGELKAAGAIQMGLLPRRFPTPPHHEIELYAFLEPAREVGGDLYDFLFLDSGHLAFVIADVAGKGVPAALFMAMTREVLRAALHRFGRKLDQVFDDANEKIAASSEDMLGDGADMMFVTLFAGVLELATGALFYSNAGHESPLILSDGFDIAELPCDSGPPIGALEDFKYKVQRRQLAPGEMLLLYTDGVTEAQTASGGFYGLPRLKNALAARNNTMTSRDIVELIRSDVRSFVAGGEQSDDLTLMAVRWSGPARGL